LNEYASKIAPSLLSADILHLERDIKEVEKQGADWLHIDIMDGHFVPNLTFGPDLVAAVRKVTALPLDVHLMIDNPEVFISAFAEAGADFLSVQVESTPHIHKVLQDVQKHGVKAGVVLNPGTPVELIEPVLHDVAVVLVMTVNPGLGGQTFIESTVDKIKLLDKIRKEKDLHFEIEVDGGIVPETAGICLEAGANVFVSGSYLFKKNEIAVRMSALKEALKSK